MGEKVFVSHCDRGGAGEDGKGSPPAATWQGRSQEASSASLDPNQVPKAPSTHRGQQDGHSSTRRSVTGPSRAMLKRRMRNAR